MFRIELLDVNNVEDDLFEYAVIVTKHKDKWTLVRHEKRETWEIPGGHREFGEDIFDTAKRELVEETGALKFHVEEVCAYSVTMDYETSYGLLCYSEVDDYASELTMEICERREFYELPSNLTYPKILPTLFAAVKNYNEEKTDELDKKS